MASRPSMRNASSAHPVPNEGTEHTRGHSHSAHDHSHGGHERGSHSHGGHERGSHSHDEVHSDHDHSGHNHGHGGHNHGHGDHEHDHDHGSGQWAKLKHMIVPHSHDSNEAIQSAEESSKEGIRAAWIGLAGMAVTAILQMFIVAISGSIALLADTLHNVGHAVTTIPLVIAFRIGQRAASRMYSYGYRRAEDLERV